MSGVIEPGPGLPPHIALLLNEGFDFSEPRLVARRLREMVRELKDQANIGGFESLLAVDQNKPEFRAVLSGGLDLFSSTGACQAFTCRLRYADQIARTIALMSDRVTAHDFFYERIHALRSRPTNAELMGLVADVAILKRLQPLIEAGVFRFISPFMPACASCFSEFNRRVHELGEQTVSRLGDQLIIERNANGGHIDLSALYDPSLFIHFSREFGGKASDDEIRSRFVQEAVRSTVWDARSAAWTSGSVFSNSPAGISALLSADGAYFTSPELRAFAAERTATLPWVANLTIEQTLNLRDAASSALPQLREFMARRLSGVTSADESESCWREVVAELREQAELVQSELAIATNRSPSLGQSSAGILGLTVSAACLITDGPGSALGGLLGTLGLVHSLGSTHRSTLRTKPGYVLVAARDILQHAQ